MKRIKSSLFVKVIAFILFVVSGLGAVLGAVATIYMEDEGVYAGGSKQFSGTHWEQEISRNYEEVLYRYLSNKIYAEPDADAGEWSPDTETYQLRAASKLDPDNTNFCYRVKVTTEHSNYTVALNNSMENVPVIYTSKFYKVSVLSNGNVTFFIVDRDVNVAKNKLFRQYGIANYLTTYEEYTIMYGMNPVVSKMDSYYLANQVYSFCVTYRHELIAATIAAAVFWVVSLVFLLCAVGHKKGEEEIQPNWQDVIPFDLYLVIFAGVVACVFAIAAEISYYITISQSVFLFLPILTVIGFLLLGALLTTFTTRCKTKSLFRNTVCAWVIRFCVKVVKGIWNALMRVIRNIPYIWVQLSLAIVFVVANVLLAAVALNGYGDGFAAFLWLVLQAIIVAVIVYCSLCVNRVMQGAKKLAAGQQRTRVANDKMVLHYKELAENLNRLGEGMERAVAEQVKSERMKTELITNVSHDIKTPITSLINYVDLLKKEEIENETAKEYIEVLERQAARLKKLTEDLVEASKASTGNIAVNITPTDVVELLHQSIAEYADRLEASRLKPMVNATQDKIVIPADGRLLWRIYDNLLSNICKYSMPDTRVYFDVALSEQQVQITAKNISREVLNISADELKERFVRGDSARHTDGSGLGLSIAESLTQLQGGSFHLFVDGDLFKAVLVFSRIKAEPEPVEDPDIWEVGNIEEAVFEPEPMVTVYTSQAEMSMEELAETQPFVGDTNKEETAAEHVEEQDTSEDINASDREEYEMQKAYEEDTKYEVK